MHHRALLLSIMLALVAVMGCEELVTLALDEIREEEELTSPSGVLLFGVLALTEPCQFEITLIGTDDNGYITDFRQTGGDLPPGHSMAIEEGNVSEPDVIALITGPPVNAGRWTAYFVAIDNEGYESPEKDVPLTCVQRTE